MLDLIKMKEFCFTKDTLRKAENKFSSNLFLYSSIQCLLSTLCAREHGGPCVITPGREWSRKHIMGPCAMGAVVEEIRAKVVGIGEEDTWKEKNFLEEAIFKLGSEG